MGRFRRAGRALHATAMPKRAGRRAATACPGVEIIEHYPVDIRRLGTLCRASCIRHCIRPHDGSCWLLVGRWEARKRLRLPRRLGAQIAANIRGLPAGADSASVLVRPTPINDR
jgi:hypothetical protein